MKITSGISYNQYEQGDVAFKVSIPTEAFIDSYWLTKADIGFDANLSIIISIYHTKVNIPVFDHATRLWQGGYDKYCKLYRVDLNESVPSNQYSSFKFKTA